MSKSTDSQNLAVAGRTGHIDTFCRDQLPPLDLWPEMDWSLLPGFGVSGAAELRSRIARPARCELAKVDVRH